MRRIRRALIRFTLPVITAMTTAVVFAYAPCFAQSRSARLLTSNNVIALAGSGDTLWLATERGFNYRTSTDMLGGFSGVEVNDLSRRLWGMAFGDGYAVALVNNKNTTSSDQIGFWQYSHAGAIEREKYFGFSNDLHSDSTGAQLWPLGGLIFARGSFWAPFGIGGMVRYYASSNDVYTIRPGDSSETLPQDIRQFNIDDSGGDSKTVLSLDVSVSGDSIIVTTPSVIWAYSPNNKKWDTLHTGANSALSSSEEKFVAFDAAFVTSKQNVSTLYSFMTIKRNGEDENYHALYSFDNVSKRWFKAIDSRASFSVFPAASGAMYVVDDNKVRLYADTASVTGGRDFHLSEILTHSDFSAMFVKAGGEDPYPKINDILFLPRRRNFDDVGMLAVATEIGLYLCDSANALFGNYNFSLIRDVRDVKSGESYALPGVIRGGADGRYDKCVFVYKLKKDGNVTIKIYDYNMSLVKTVVKGARRRAGIARSTDPFSDVWDGTNEVGKRVWPGVYYFKITSSGGDRLFGKVILAK